MQKTKHNTGQANVKFLMKILFFTLTVILSLLLLNQIFMKKIIDFQAVNGQVAELPYLPEKWDGFYEKTRDTIDMLFIGTSVVHTGVDVNYLYHEYGFTSYDLAADQMAGPNVYYFLKEAVKYQSPQVIFVDVQSLSHADNPQPVSLHYNFDYMKQGLNRIQGIAEHPATAQTGNFFPFIEYHTRWEELEETDFRYMFQDKLNMLNGYFIYMLSYDSPVPDVYEESDQTLSELGYTHTEENLNRIISYCCEQGMECVLFRTPQSYSESQSQYYDALEKYADENNIRFWNFNDYYAEIGMDFSTDFVDGQHLNYIGSRKFTAFLGKLISEQFEYTDHRGTKGYEEWDVAYDYENYLIHAYEILHYVTAQQYLDNNDLLSDELLYIYTYRNREDLQKIAGMPEIPDRLQEEDKNDSQICIVEKGVILQDIILPPGETWEDHDLLQQEDRLLIESLKGKTKIWFGDTRAETEEKNGLVDLLIYDKKLGKVLDHVTVNVNNNFYLLHYPVE